MSVGVLKPSESNDASAPAPAASRSGAVAWLGLIALLLLVLFGPHLLRLADLWSTDPSYSHGFLIPFISLWLAIRAYRQLPAPVEGDVRIGSMAILAGCMLHLLTMILAWPPLDFIALSLVLWGLAVTVGGGEWSRGFLFAIGFLFFMYPLPVTWTSYLALVLQDWVAGISASILDPFIVCYRRGNVLHLAGVPEPLVVAAECSGLRQIVAFVALGTLVAGLSEKPRAFRVLLVLSAVPVAILANVARILLMALGAVWFGTGWISGWLHDAPSALTFPLGLALFIAVGWGLGRFFSTRPRSEDCPSEEATPCT
jgi:exosortase